MHSPPPLTAWGAWMTAADVADAQASTAPPHTAAAAAASLAAAAATAASRGASGPTHMEDETGAFEQAAVMMRVPSSMTSAHNAAAVEAAAAAAAKRKRLSSDGSAMARGGSGAPSSHSPSMMSTALSTRAVSHSGFWRPLSPTSVQARFILSRGESDPTAAASGSMEALSGIGSYSGGGSASSSRSSGFLPCNEYSVSSLTSARSHSSSDASSRQSSTASTPSYHAQSLASRSPAATSRLTQQGAAATAIAPDSPLSRILKRVCISTPTQPTHRTLDRSTHSSSQQDLRASSLLYNTDATRSVQSIPLQMPSSAPFASARPSTEPRPRIKHQQFESAPLSLEQQSLLHAHALLAHSGSGLPSPASGRQIVRAKRGLHPHAVSSSSHAHARPERQQHGATAGMSSQEVSPALSATSPALSIMSEPSYSMPHHASSAAAAAAAAAAFSNAASPAFVGLPLSALQMQAQAAAATSAAYLPPVLMPAPALHSYTHSLPLSSSQSPIASLQHLPSSRSQPSHAHHRKPHIVSPSERALLRPRSSSGISSSGLSSLSSPDAQQLHLDLASAVAASHLRRPPPPPQPVSGSSLVPFPRHPSSASASAAPEAAAAASASLLHHKRSNLLGTPQGLEPRSLLFRANETNTHKRTKERGSLRASDGEITAPAVVAFTEESEAHLAFQAQLARLSAPSSSPAVRYSSLGGTAVMAAAVVIPSPQMQQRVLSPAVAPTSGSSFNASFHRQSSGLLDAVQLEPMLASFPRPAGRISASNSPFAPARGGLGGGGSSLRFMGALQSSPRRMPVYSSNSPSPLPSPSQLARRASIRRAPLRRLAGPLSNPPLNRRLASGGGGRISTGNSRSHSHHRRARTPPSSNCGIALTSVSFDDESLFADPASAAAVTSASPDASVSDSDSNASSLQSSPATDTRMMLSTHAVPLRLFSSARPARVPAMHAADRDSPAADLFNRKRRDPNCMQLEHTNEMVAAAANEETESQAASFAPAVTVALSAEVASPAALSRRLLSPVLVSPYASSSAPASVSSGGGVGHVSVGSASGVSSSASLESPLSAEIPQTGLFAVLLQSQPSSRSVSSVSGSLQPAWPAPS